MDNEIFRDTYRSINERFCVFEKSILTNNCECSRAQRFCIAEREGVHCRSETGQARCLRWLDLLREQARFALRTEEGRQLLPHGKAMRLQVGGIRGLQRVLGITRSSPTQTIDDVDGTLAAAEARFGALDNLPFSEIMREVAAYQIRKRSRRNR